ncbi:Uncharacterised protein [Paucimonas lemoignei]|nr:Uncharacterised protein [Paucimonas lemoignei]
MNKPSNILLGGSNLISFSAGTLAEEKSDILDCLAYAEIKASDRYNRKRHWAQWVDRYQLELYKNGFEITDALPGERLVLTDPRDLYSVVSDALETGENRELERLARSSFLALLGSEDGQTLFRTWFSKERSENVQIIPCIRDAHGRIEILFCGLELVIATTESSWFEGSRSKIAITISGGEYRYSSANYERYRQKVDSFLEAHTRESIRNI